MLSVCSAYLNEGTLTLDRTDPVPSCSDLGGLPLLLERGRGRLSGVCLELVVKDGS
jgi:hypothetical protein